MPRLPRVQFPGAMYHVSIQGNRDCSIYNDVDDREVFLSITARAVELDGWICHAYCEMTTHYHLLIQTPKANLDRGMHRLNSAYAHWFNKRHAHEGHLFKRRYSARPVVDQSHLLHVVRYVVLNPVRARMCRHPREWPWSSYAATAGLVKAPAFLDIRWTAELFAGDVAKGRRRFVQFVEEGIEPVPGTGV
jgi:putative transposase